MRKPKGNQRRNLINKKVLHRYNKSNFIRHAKRELDLAGYTDSCGPNKWMRDQVLELLAVFATHGNSGHSAPFEINLFSKLAMFKTISPLTFKDEEWNPSYDLDGTQQNNRNSTFFKYADGSIRTIDAYCVNYTSQWLVGASEWQANNTGITWSGGIICEIDKDNICTGRAFSSCRLWLHDVEKGKYVPKEKHVLKCKEVEISKDSWMGFIEKDSTDLLILACDYNINWRECPSLKGKLCNTLTDDDEKIVLEEIKTDKA